MGVDQTKIMVPENCPYAALSRTFRALAESGHGIMIGFSFIYRFIKSGIQTFRGLPPLLCHNNGGAICANCIANSAGYSAVARLTDHPITGLLIGLSLFGIKLG